MLLLEAALDALAILVPVTCAGCGAEDRAVCPACRAALVPHPVQRRIGDPALAVTSGLRYEGEARSVILALKEHGRTDAARPLAAALTAALASALSLESALSPEPLLEPSAEPPLDHSAEPPLDLSRARSLEAPLDLPSARSLEPPSAMSGDLEIAPVPSSRAALRRRGFDPVLLLVRRASLPRPSRVLRGIRRTERQKTLDVESRASNLVGSMRARYPLDGRRFLLVDDVLTTGATLVEAARAIRDAGGEAVAAVTVADTPKRFGAASDGSPVNGWPTRSPP